MTDSISKPSRFRTLTPWFILAFGGAVLAAIWLIDWGEGSMRAFQVFATQALGGLVGLLMILWLALLSPFRWSTRLMILLPVLAGVGFLAYAFQFEGVTGDMRFLYRFRWSAKPHELVKKSREEAGKATGEIKGPLHGLAETDYPEYRGRARDGVIRKGPSLKVAKPAEIWRHPIGAGHSGFAIAGPLAFTLEQRDDNYEAVVAYDVADGRERWIYSYEARFFETAGDLGPRATPTIRDEVVYALGATGILTCLNARTGELKWKVDTLQGNNNVTWGISGSPLVADIAGRRVVIVNPGKQAPSAPRGTLVAYDAETGKELWSAGDGEAGYSSPMVATLDGKEQILLFDGDGLSGYDPLDGGKQLWRVPWPVQQHINVGQPLLLSDDRVFITSGYGVGCAMFEVKQKNGTWEANQLWKNRRMRSRFGSPVYHDGYIYGLDDGRLVCLDAKTGDRQWSGPRYLNGQILLSDGKLIVSVEEDGAIAMLEATPEAAKELVRFDAVRGRLWNPFALSDGLLFVRNHREMACFDLTGTR